MAAEAADRAFLDGHEDLMVTGESANEVGIQRLHKACIRNGCREAECRELVGRLQALCEPRAKRQQGSYRAFADDTPFADLKNCTLGRHFDANTLSAWVTHGRGPIVDCHRCR